MIEIADIRISTDVPGIAEKFLAYIRFLDKSKGSFIGESGIEILNYDKQMSYTSNNLEYLLARLGNDLTNILCSEELS